MTGTDNRPEMRADDARIATEPIPTNERTDGRTYGDLRFSTSEDKSLESDTRDTTDFRRGSGRLTRENALASARAAVTQAAAYWQERMRQTGDRR